MINITPEMNRFGFSSIIASIYYYEQAINSSTNLQNIIDKLKGGFYEKNGFMSSNMNRSKLVFDICEKYNIPNGGYDDIHSFARQLKRPNDEINEILAQIR